MGLIEMNVKFLSEWYIVSVGIIFNISLGIVGVGV